MAELLNDRYFQKDFINQLGTDIHEVDNNFNQDLFEKKIYADAFSWNHKTLKERLYHVSRCMKEVLLDDYKIAIGIIDQIFSYILK